MRPLFTILFLVATIVAATAQTPSAESRAAAVRLVEALDWRGVMEPVREDMVARAKANLRTTVQEELGSPTDKEYAEVDTIVDELIAHYTIDDTLADIIPLLQAHYSTAEMDELAKLLSAPVYKKFQAELPAINREAMYTMNKKMQPLIEDTLRRVFVRIDEMKKARSGK